MNGPKSAIWLLFAVFLPLTAQGMTLERFSKKVAQRVDTDLDQKVAVLPFPYHDGGVSSGSSILSERLTTALVKRRVRVVERHLIKKILEEKKLRQSGVVKGGSVEDIGTLLGVDALLTGTLIDLDRHNTELNARLIDSQSGEIIYAEKVLVRRSWRDAPKKRQKEVLVQKQETPTKKYNPLEDPDVILEHTPPSQPSNLEPVQTYALKHNAYEGGVIHLSNYDFPEGSYTDQAKKAQEEEERQRQKALEAFDELVNEEEQEKEFVMNQVLAAFDVLLEGYSPQK